MNDADIKNEVSKKCAFTQWKHYIKRIMLKIFMWNSLFLTFYINQGFLQEKKHILS